jgi:hypothetical protein
MKDRVETLVQQAFRLSVELYGLPSSVNSSSATSGPQTSLLGGSFEQISTPRTTGRQQSSSASRSITTRSQVYSMDVSSTPSRNSMVASSRRHGTDMLPPVINLQSMPPQNFVTSNIGASHPAHEWYPVGTVGLSDDSTTFIGSNFDESDLGASGAQWSGMDFDSSPANFSDNHTPVNMARTEFVSNLAQTLISPPEDGSRNLDDFRDWDQFAGSRPSHYRGGQH